MARVHPVRQQVCRPEGVKCQQEGRRRGRVRQRSAGNHGELPPAGGPRSLVERLRPPDPREQVPRPLEIPAGASAPEGKTRADAQAERAEAEQPARQQMAEFVHEDIQVQRQEAAEDDRRHPGGP